MSLTESIIQLEDSLLVDFQIGQNLVIDAVLMLSFKRHDVRNLPKTQGHGMTTHLVKDDVALLVILVIVLVICTIIIS